MTTKLCSAPAAFAPRAPGSEAARRFKARVTARGRAGGAGAVAEGPVFRVVRYEVVRKGGQAPAKDALSACEDAAVPGLPRLGSVKLEDAGRGASAKVRKRGGWGAHMGSC